ncbi:MAG: hypothetical protein AMJ78_02400 [Omnitrophica WOR_2 bacterium SM23_29]|nr:MAG: hypothetical protein AMJ78_02400 [Omnitrophica WOR_2 bacterium SM23_29]
MAIQTTEALVLNRRDFRETSVLATFYSKDFGKVKGILKGIRSEKHRYGSSAELFSLNKIVFYEKSRGEFNNITQCDLIDGFFGIRKCLSAIAYANYIVELVDAMTEPDEKNIRVYELLHKSLRLLSKGEEPNRITRIFELKFLCFLGFAPMLNSCIHCNAPVSEKARFSLLRRGMLCERCLKEDPNARAVSKGTVQTLRHLENAKLDSLSKFKITKSIESELSVLIEELLESHLEKPLKSKKFIKDIQKLTK